MQKTAVRPVAAAAQKAVQQEMESLTVKDDKAFKQAVSVNTKESYTTYLMLYPEGKHVEEAKAKISAFEQETAAQKEKQSTQQGTESAAEREKRESEAASARQKNPASIGAEAADHFPRRHVDGP